MSSDGTRKSTKGWEMSPSGGMALGGNNVVVLEEPTRPAMAAMTEGARGEAARAEVATMEVSAPQEGTPRPRRTTLDLFNDEMAVMERPIEGDVEYIDEKPRGRWPHVAAFIATVAIVGIGGAFLISRHRGAVAAQGTPVPAATVAALSPASPPVAASKPAVAAVAPAAQPAANAPAEDAEADDEPAADGTRWKAPARTEWSKVHTKVTRSKHGGGKVVSRRTTTTTVKHRHVVKRTVSGRR